MYLAFTILFIKVIWNIEGRLQSSCHYKRWLNNIPLGQFRRIRWNCINNKDFQTPYSRILTKRLKEKGYPSKIIKGAHNRASQMSQEMCIQPRNTQSTNNKNIDYKHAFVTIYNKNHTYIRDVLNKYWYVIKNIPQLKELLPNKPGMIFRRSCTLKDVLAPCNIKKTPNWEKVLKPVVRLIWKAASNAIRKKCKCCCNMWQNHHF